MRKVAHRQLTELGYGVVEAEGATAALDMLASQPVALMFSDVVMPGELSGIDLAQIAMSR